MGFKGHATAVYYTIDSLKDFIEAYKKVLPGLTWGEANDIIDTQIPKYSKTYYQVADHFGIQYKSGNKKTFTISKYLLCLDDDLLKKYLKFWAMVYFAPSGGMTHNPGDTPINIFVKLAEEIIASPTHSVNFSSFYTRHMGVGRSDPTKDALKDYIEYIYLVRDDFKVDPSNITSLKTLIGFIKKEFPVPPIVDIKDKRKFFDRFSEQNFRKFFRFFDEELVFPCDKLDHNKIIYGAPGTGKSYRLKEEAACCFDPDKIERVTFFNGYTYGQFIGTYKPVPVYREPKKTFNYRELIKKSFTRTLSSEPYVVYEYVSGILLNMILNALLDKEHKYCLIIEEINRARPDAVFGDMFQLLDRDDRGQSEYRVKCTNEMMDYIKTRKLDKNMLKDIENNGIYIPDNLYLWATMNSADQGVFPMDTAFKRRWSFEYIGIEDNKSKMDIYHINTNETKPVNDSWNNFRKKLNKHLSDHHDIPEDKMLAPFFVKQSDFNAKKTLREEIFINKVIMYLKEDVLRHRKNDKIFIESRFSDIVDAYKDKKPIFDPEFIAELNT